MPVDERAILEAVASLPLAGNEEGLIPAFGLHLTHHPADHYNRISFGLLGAFAREHSDLAEDAIALLVEAGHVCSFHTFGGVMSSVEWDAVVRPMLSTREDWVFGMVAVMNALGWGEYRVTSLEPGERLVLELTSSYEAAGHLESYGKAESPRCFLARGGAAGLMNLIYQGDILARPALTEAHYIEVFGHPRSFRAKETRCLATGDDRCEIVAERMQG
jgi:hypothetical protein